MASSPFHLQDADPDGSHLHHQLQTKHVLALCHSIECWVFAYFFTFFFLNHMSLLAWTARVQGEESNVPFYRMYTDNHLLSCLLPSPRPMRMSSNSTRSQGACRGRSRVHEGRETNLDREDKIDSICPRNLWNNKQKPKAPWHVYHSAFDGMLKLLIFLFLGVTAFKICMCIWIKMGAWEKAL